MIFILQDKWYSYNELCTWLQISNCKNKNKIWTILGTKHKLIKFKGKYGIMHSFDGI